MKWENNVSMAGAHGVTDASTGDLVCIEGLIAWSFLACNQHLAPVLVRDPLERPDASPAACKFQRRGLSEDRTRDLLRVKQM